jgi:antitoxin (DNA-binding transcriptional repressor) of toxin-antitoxin stability system
MRHATVRDLRYRFPEIEDLLQHGEEIEITKRKRVIAHLVPVRPKGAIKWPDFQARLKAIFGDRILQPTTAELLAEERERF